MNWNGSQQNAGTDCNWSLGHILGTQEANHENYGKVYLRTSGRTGVVVLYEHAHCALCWFQVSPADRLFLLTTQMEIRKNCDKVPLNCYFVSAWREQRKMESQ